MRKYTLWLLHWNIELLYFSCYFLFVHVLAFFSFLFSCLSFCVGFSGTSAVHQDSLLRLNCLYNRAIRITCCLHKSDHISIHCQTIGWLPVSLLIQHRTLCAMMDQFTGRGIQFNPPLQFRQLHTHNTRCPTLFASICWCRLALTKCHFWQKATVPNFIVHLLLIFSLCACMLFS